MLWACLLFPSLPLDVFVRALTPAEAARPLVITNVGGQVRVGPALGANYIWSMSGGSMPSSTPWSSRVRQA